MNPGSPIGEAEARQLDATVAVLTRALGSRLIGIYLYGSAVLGGLRPCSDLDLLAVVDGATSASQRRELTVGMMEVSGGRGTRRAGRPIEVTVVRSDTVRPLQELPQREFQYGEWLRDDYATGFVPQPGPDADLLPLLATVHAAAEALLGPPAAEVVDPVPAERLIGAIPGLLPTLMADLDVDTTNVLLTLARMWFTTVTGTVTTKDAAAIWALARLPWDLIPPLAHACDVYIGGHPAGSDRLAAPAAATAAHLEERIVSRAGRR